MQQALDFRAASDALRDLVAPLDDADFARPTGFKGWTIDAILRHLHVWNEAADMSLRDAAAFHAFFDEVKASLGKGGLPVFEEQRLGASRGRRWSRSGAISTGRWPTASLPPIPRRASFGRGRA